jgi:DNA-binding GntR family transcriptional regulator
MPSMGFAGTCIFVYLYTISKLMFQKLTLLNVELLPEKIANTLRKAIVEGHLAPGTRLVEADLSQQFHVSRIPLREAFRVLEGEGLINIVPHRGAIVSQLRDEELVELFKVRALFEVFAVEHLTENPNPAILKKLDSIIGQMRLVIASGDVSTYYGLASEFHETLVSGANNFVLAHQYEQIKGKLNRYQAALSRLPESPKKSLAEHSKIVKHIKSGNKDLASISAKEHIDDLINRYLNSRSKECTKESLGKNKLNMEKTVP